MYLRPANEREYPHCKYLFLHKLVNPIVPSRRPATAPLHITRSNSHTGPIKNNSPHLGCTPRPWWCWIARGVIFGVGIALGLWSADLVGACANNKFFGEGFGDVCRWLALPIMRPKRVISNLNLLHGHTIYNTKKIDRARIWRLDHNFLLSRWAE